MKKQITINEINRAPWEKFLFLFTITFVGGYMNAYTYVTRHEILANMHTANMSRFGISVAEGLWEPALSFFLPIIACILGAAFSEFLKKLISESRLAGDWRKYALMLEAAVLFAAGCVPLWVPDMFVTLPLSFIMGYQLCLFRNFEGTAHNTTICTGNLRNVGQVLFKALDEKTGRAWRNVAVFAGLTFSFALGALPGTWLSHLLDEKASWICALLILAESLWIFRYDKTKAEQEKAEA